MRPLPRTLSAPSPSSPPARWPPLSSPRPPRRAATTTINPASCRAAPTWPSPTSRARPSWTARSGSRSRRRRCGCSASPARRTSSARPTGRAATASSSASQPDGTRTRLARADVFQTELSGDGQHLVTTKVPSNRKTIVTVWSATTGATVASRSFKGYASALDADTDRVLVGGAGQDLALDHEHRLGRRRRPRRRATPATSRPTCSPATPRTPTTAAAQSCARSRPASGSGSPARSGSTRFNADGTSDGHHRHPQRRHRPGLRRRPRQHRRTSSAPTRSGGWFGAIEFETTTALLLETNGPRKAATVRCTDAGCERASALSPTVQPRVA